MKNYIATALLLSSSSALKVKQKSTIKNTEQAELVAEADALIDMDLENTLEADEQQEVFEVTDVDPASLNQNQISLAQVSNRKKSKNKKPHESAKLQISSQSTAKQIDQDNLIEAVAAA